MESPYEIVYERPFLDPQIRGENINIKEDTELEQYMQQIIQIVATAHKHVSTWSWFQLETPCIL
jgi:hypothetical protein